MPSSRKSDFLKSQILDTEKLLRLVGDNRFMSVGLKEKLDTLKKELIDLENAPAEAKVQLLFSGNAVVGSEGIKSTFVSKTISPFQEMVKTQTALLKFGRVGKRGQARNSSVSDLYLTALPIGSFGVELTQLETKDLFDSSDVSSAISDIMTLVENSATDDQSFEKIVENIPSRNLTNLRKFLEEISEEKSTLRMESGEQVVELTSQKVREAYDRVSQVTSESEEIFISGIFRGLLLDSGRFEVQDETGQKISGFINEEISEEQLVYYDQNYVNKPCRLHIKMHKTTFKTGFSRTEYELLEITDK